MSDFRTTINHIIRKKSIIDYLSQRGIDYLKPLSGGRYLYYCPIPDHAESKPSFYVWTQSEYENYYCFGCRSNHNIINLVSALDGISFREALNKLCDGMKFTIEDDIELDKIRCSKEWKIDPSIFPFQDMMVSISHACYVFLKSVEFDPEETSAIDQTYNQIDHYLMTGEVHEIENIYSSISKVLKDRKIQYRQRQRAMRKSEILSEK